MAQKATTIDLSAGLVPKQKPASGTIDLSSGFVDQNAAPESRQPTAAEQQISEQTRNAPLETSWLRSPLSAIGSLVKGLADPAVSFYQAAKQRDIELGGEGNPVMGAPDALLDAFTSGEAQSRRRMGEGLRGAGWNPAKQAQAIVENLPVVGAMARPIAETAKDDPYRAGGQLASLYLYPKVGEAARGAMELPSPPEVLRDYSRRTVRAGPAQVERAAGEGGAEASRVSARNATATAEADLRNTGAFSEAQRAHSEAMTKWQQRTTEGQAAYDQAQAEHTAAETQRGTLRTQAAQQSEKLVEGLRESAKNVEAKVKQMYPKIEGEVEDTGVLAESIRSAAEKQMREAGPIPAEVERIVRQYTPKEAEGELMVDGEPVEAGSDLAAKLKAQGAPGFEEAGPGEPAARATFENLHSQYSALGRLARQAEAAGNGYRAAAYQAARGVIRDAMENLATAADKAEEFQAAQKEWGRMEKTFYEKSSPVAKALAKIDDIYASLKDDPEGARQAAAPYVRQILSEAKAAGYSSKLLAQFEGAPTEALKGMLDALEQAKKVPKTKAPKPFVPEPQPRYEPPVPAHTAELAAPPEPFNKQGFIKSQVQKTAEDLQATRGATAIYKHPVGRFLEHPNVQDWIAKEPPEPFGQPGQPGAQGAATPFNQPPPSGPSSPTTGPSTPSGAGPSTIRGAERRIAPGESPTGDERRSLSRRAIDTVKSATRLTSDAQEELAALQSGRHVEYQLKKLGLKHQPLSPDMRAELEMVLLEKPSISRAEVRSIQSVLDSWGRGTFDSYEAGNRIRSALRLPEQGE